MENIGIIGGADGPTAIFMSGAAVFGNSDVSPWTALAAYVITMIAAYFIGNISPAILIGRAHGVDIKKEGSGNAGTTNVLRVLGKKAAAATLIIDVAKGSAAALLGGLVGGEFLMGACAMFVMLGHIWPAAFRFKGGKGVATAFGAILLIDPLIALAELGVVAIVVLITRMVSLGSICAAIALPVLAFFFIPSFLPCSIIMAVVVLIKHRSNIKRIFGGTESKLF